LTAETLVVEQQELPVSQAALATEQPAGLLTVVEIAIVPATEPKAC
jgi:hypothetical protein